MNRSNFWIRVGIVGILVVTAAVLGQIRRWQAKPFPNIEVDHSSVQKPRTTSRTLKDAEPEVLVRFKPGVKLSEIKKIAGRFNDRVEDNVESVKGLVAIDDLDGADMETVAGQYKALGDLVDYVSTNDVITLDDPASPVATRDALLREPSDNMPNDPEFGNQWALSNTGQDGGKAGADLSALNAWTKTKGSKEVVVAVLDTGVDYTHLDLASNMWIRPDNVPQYFDEELGTYNDLQGFDANINASDPMDDNGHGTHCSGIVGAEGNNNEGIAGINWNVQIMPLKFLGKGGYGTTKDAIEAINYAIDRKQKGVNIRIISASWGSTSYSKALEDVIRAAGEQGILFVAAAGNATTDNDKRPHYPSNYDLPNVISVAALDRTDSLASFSNYGAKTVHVAAPGREIVSTWLNNAYREASGTSMATPYVSGVAALVIANEPNISVEKLRERIIKSVDKIDSLNGKVVSGGRINAAKALGVK
ncbi:MAG: S8 family serine peptidase [Acidobacteria bacterium]|nr:S8 family serine peptidase [Acidobacteriota bacterium]